MFAKITRPGANLRNLLFALSDQENKQLSFAWQSDHNNELKKLHDQVLATIPRIDGLTVLKSVSLHYMEINCQDQQFWFEVGKQLEKILLSQEWKPQTYTYIYQLAFVFGQIQRKQLIQDEQIFNQYLSCSEIILKIIQNDILNQNSQNISHIIALISQYDMKGQMVTEIAEKLQKKTNFQKFTIQDLIFYFWSLKSSKRIEFFKIGVYGFYNEQILNIIQKQSSSLDQNLWSKLLIIIAQFKPRNEKFINAVVERMPAFELKQLVSLIAIYIKTSFNQSLCLFPILLALKKQFTEHFENENKDAQIICDGIKFLTFIPAQIGRQYRQLLADNIDAYGKYILYNLQHFDQYHLIDVICMANYFQEKEQMLELIKSRLNSRMKMDATIFFLLNIIQYEEQFSQQITDHLNQLNKMKKGILELPDDKHLQLMLALSHLKDKYPKANELLSLQNESKLIRQFQTFVNKNIKESIISETGFRLHFKFYQGFMSNNFEFNLYICERLGVFKYVKESRINLHLLDYRLFDINKNNFDLAKLKQMQQDQGLLKDFLQQKYDKYDDVTVDRENEQQSLFIEVDGSNHYDLMGQPINRTVCKKEQLKKSKQIIHTISLDEKIEIANSLKSIQEILDQ